MFSYRGVPYRRALYEEDFVEISPRWISGIRKWWKQADRDRDSVALPSKLRAKYYYHGTASKAAANKILSTCSLTGRKTARRPDSSIPNRVYLTPHLWYAFPYMFGEHTNKPTGQYGYLFAVDKQDLMDVWLDEDFVGELIYNTQVPWLVTLFRQLIDRYPRDFYRACGGLERSEFLTRFDRGDYPQVSQVGKFILRHTDEATKSKILDEWLTVGVDDALALSHTGAVPVSKAWRVKTEYSSDLWYARNHHEEEKKFLELAEEIPLTC